MDVFRFPFICAVVNSKVQKHTVILNLKCIESESILDMWMTNLEIVECARIDLALRVFQPIILPTNEKKTYKMV